VSSVPLILQLLGVLIVVFAAMSATYVGRN
jgi:hypothetical protein